MSSNGSKRTTRPMKRRDPKARTSPASSSFPDSWRAWPPLKRFHVYKLHIISTNACQKLIRTKFWPAAVQLQPSHLRRPERAIHIWQESTDQPTRAAAEMINSIQNSKSSNQHPEEQPETIMLKKKDSPTNEIWKNQTTKNKIFQI